MVDKETTSSPATSPPTTPNPKRTRMSSPDRAGETSEQSSKKDEKAEKSEDDKEPEHEVLPATESADAPEVTSTESLSEDSDLEADEGYFDSGFRDDRSDTTSVTSSIYQGFIENGRRYQTKREGDYWGPADEKQFLSMEAAHLVYLLLESKRKNPYFLSPISRTAQNILDVGTGSGIWAKEVADLFPSAVVQGVDLSPPTDTWVPPNCKFEVDDVLKRWPWKHQFDLIHLRELFGSFSDEQWRLVYKQAYQNLAPGGWIEHVETSIVPYSDDGSLPQDSLLANWGNMFYPLYEKIGKPINTIDTFKARIEAAGFTNVHEKNYKVPFGDWAKGTVWKEAGTFHKRQIMEGLEGYVMFTLTRFGEPTPWTPDEVQVFLAKIRQEANAPGLHAYWPKKRVWAQKPFDKELKTESRVEVEKLA